MSINNMMENSYSLPMRFVDATYFMIITSGTIGYGDYYPVTFISRMVMIMLIIIIITVFGNQISALTAIIKEADFYDTHYEFQGHIVVTGTLRIKVISRFLL